MTAREPKKSNVVIVGAAAGGTSAAEGLRARGHEGRITMIGAEQHAPYDRPPLSKQFIKGDIDEAALALRPWNHFQNLGVVERFGVSAVSLDTRRGYVALSDGTAVDYDRLIIATGVSARSLPHTSGVAGVHTVRTLDDASRIREALPAASRVAVIGGGFLGSEIAAVASMLGFEVLLACTGTNLLGKALGNELGRQVSELHASRGVKVITGQGAAVQRLLISEGAVIGVEFKSGIVENADLVVVAIGATPAVDWLESSSLSLNDGIRCSPDCSAAQDVYAIGDVARWHNPLFNVSMRIEHRTNATDQALHVADRIMLGDRTAYAPVPYFWSDQFELKIQSHGYLRDHDEAKIIEGDLSSGRLVVLYRKGPTLCGVVAVGAAKALRQWRAFVSQRMSWKEALTHG